MPTLHVFLVDGSGSMRPAWDAAWSHLFEEARSIDQSFAILVFKQLLNLTDLATIGRVRAAGRDPVIIDTTNLKVVNYGDVLVTTERKLRRVPHPLITFSHRTPLNDAIIAVLELVDARYRRTGVRYILTVVSDNRDYGSTAKWNHVVSAKEQAEGLEKLRIIAVGDFLNRYLEPYDEVVR